MVRIDPGKDLYFMMRVTYDEASRERIKLLYSSCWNGIVKPLYLSGKDLLLSCIGDRCPILIVSHPRSTKKIIVGQEDVAQPSFVDYNTATCLGSGGAPGFFVLLRPRGLAL